jgi:UDP-2,4-diacetamido-2,4,6-trideoxy-beta-L-altropyranose hydrolase
VLFRVDASSTIGVGHLARDLTLADAFRAAGYESTFAMASPPPAVRERVASKGYALCEIQSEPGSAADLAETTALSRKTDHAIVIADGYQFRDAYLRGFREQRLFCCFFDDMINLRYDCHAVFNQNFYAPPSQFDRAPDCDLILGPEHALVRDEFLEARAKRVIRDEATRVLVTMGGADPTGETSKCLAALDALEAARGLLEARVVVGPTNPLATELRARALASRHAVTVLENINNMAEQMLWCDVALTASGTTCMELACVGVPSLVTVVVDNQLLIGPEIGRLGLMKNLGWHADVTAETIASNLSLLLGDVALRREMVSRQLRGVDGAGKGRTVQRLLASFEGHRARGTAT